jgi:hypothetical protein
MIKGTGEDIHPTTLQSIQEEVEGTQQTNQNVLN